MYGSGSPNLRERLEVGNIMHTSSLCLSESEQGNLWLSLSLTGICLSPVHTTIQFSPLSTGQKFLLF